MTAEADREYLTKQFAITPSLDRFQTLAELLNFVSPHAISVLISDHWKQEPYDVQRYDPRNMKFYPDGIAADYGFDEKDYKEFKADQAETYLARLSAITNGGVQISMYYPSTLDRKSED